VRRVARVAGIVLALALRVAGWRTATSAGSPPVAVAPVGMAPGHRFDPPVITVKAGTTVPWHNGDHFTHSVRLLDGSGVEKVAAPGESVSITFNDAGEYEYNCSFHPRDRRGKVIVTE